MQKVVRLALFGAALTACHTSDPGTPDGNGDGQLPSAGIAVSWSSKPIIPGTTGGNVTVSSAVFHMDNLRVIGDAGPGDPRTTASTFVVGWSLDAVPAAISFADAPSGLYSKITLRADGRLVTNSYDIHGTVVVNGTTYPFKIEDRDPVDASIQIQTNLEPGTLASLPILVRLDDALGVVDWEHLENDNGTLELETFATQMPAFRTKLSTSFVLGN